MLLQPQERLEGYFESEKMWKDVPYDREWIWYRRAGYEIDSSGEVLTRGARP
jgi:hypothetical protein